MVDAPDLARRGVGASTTHRHWFSVAHLVAEADRGFSCYLLRGGALLMGTDGGQAAADVGPLRRTLLEIGSHMGGGE